MYFAVGEQNSSGYQKKVFRPKKLKLFGSKLKKGCAGPEKEPRFYIKYLRVDFTNKIKEVTIKHDQMTPKRGVGSKSWGNAHHGKKINICPIYGYTRCFFENFHFSAPLFFPDFARFDHFDRDFDSNRKQKRVHNPL